MSNTDSLIAKYAAEVEDYLELDKAYWDEVDYALHSAYDTFLKELRQI